MRQVMATASPPLARIAAAASSHGASLRAEMTTRAPALANPSAIARPMPREEPVTIATLPVRSKRFISALHALAHQRVTERADAGDLDFAEVAMLQVLRAPFGAHPYDVPGIE